MGHSSLLGTDEVPVEAKGRDDEALGPSDSSDSASDRVGADDLPTADPGEPVDVTLSRDIARQPIEPGEESEAARVGADISVDRIFGADEDDIEGVDSAEAIDRAMAPEAGQASDEDEDAEDEDAA